MRWILIVLLALPAAAETLEAELERMTNEMLAAIAPGDVAVWKKYTDDRYVYVTEANEVFTKAKLLEELKPLPKGLIGTLKVGDDFKVVPHGNVAVTTFVSNERLDYFGQILNSRFRQTDTWLKTKHGWRLIATQVLAILADPPAITLQRETLCGYNGVYRLTDDIKLKITCSDSGLQSERTGRKAITQKPEVRDVFFEPGQPRTRRIFQRSARGEITGFVDRREGHDIAWTKVEMNTMTTSCNSPEHRQFDFWLGDWDAYDVSDDKTPTAHIVVTLALDGCVVRETYDDPTGLKGESFSIYDASRKVWHQTWVTNRGQLLTIEGTKRGEGLFFEGSAIANGVNTLYRVVWKPEGSGVRETAETSIDGGKTWKQWFDLRFRRRTS